MIFTIDSDNNITAREAVEDGTDETNSFATQAGLQDLAKDWPMSRLVEVWNSLPGVTPVNRFKDRKAAVVRIWARIQYLAEPAAVTTPAERAKRKPTARAQASDVAKPKAKSTKKARVKETAVPREGSKQERVVAMLKRKGGASIQEIMSEMGWQRHTVRGFMAGAMKKAGYTVESFKPEGGERSYRING